MPVNMRQCFIVLLVNYFYLTHSNNCHLLCQTVTLQTHMDCPTDDNFYLLLCCLGYLTTGDDLLPGNYGLLDQIESLKWIRDNIQYFHGDASKVTLFGSSAGSTSIGLLIVSRLAQGISTYLFMF